MYQGIQVHELTPDAMTWASTWEMMSRTLQAFATRNTDSSDRGGGKSGDYEAGARQLS